MIGENFQVGDIIIFNNFHDFIYEILTISNQTDNNFWGIIKSTAGGWVSMDAAHPKDIYHLLSKGKMQISLRKSHKLTNIFKDV